MGPVHDTLQQGHSRAFHELFSVYRYPTALHKSHILSVYTERKHSPCIEVVFLTTFSTFFWLDCVKTETSVGLHVERGEIKKSPSGQNILLSSSDSPSLHLYVSHVCVYAEQMGAIAAMTRVHVFTFAEFVVMFER